MAESDKYQQCTGIIESIDPHTGNMDVSLECDGRKIFVSPDKLLHNPAVVEVNDRLEISHIDFCVIGAKVEGFSFFG